MKKRRGLKVIQSAIRGLTRTLLCAVGFMFGYIRFWNDPLAGKSSPTVFLKSGTNWRGNKSGACGESRKPLILFGAEGQNRTADTGIFSPLLYRLSYLGEPARTVVE